MDDYVPSDTNETNSLETIFVIFEGICALKIFGQDNFFKKLRVKFVIYQRNNFRIIFCNKNLGCQKVIRKCFLYVKKYPLRSKGCVF